jgi:nitrosocyanin
MSRNLVVTVVVVLLLVVAGWFLMRPKVQSTTNPVVQTETPQSTTSSAESTAGAMMAEAKEVKVVATDFAFSPKTISVKQGEKVKITLTNSGKYPHNLKIDELGMMTKIIKSGETDTVELTASKSGTFSMYCSVGDHRQRGMEGTVSIQ